MSDEEWLASDAATRERTYLVRVRVRLGVRVREEVRVGLRAATHVSGVRVSGQGQWSGSVVRVSGQSQWSGSVVRVSGQGQWSGWAAPLCCKVEPGRVLTEEGEQRASVLQRTAHLGW